MSIVPFCDDLGRFYESPPARFIVTDLSSATVTFLDRLAHNMSFTRFRSASANAQMDVPADNPEINIEAPAGDGPFVEEGVRLLYGFLRECGATPWIPRFGGIILQLDDQAGTDSPITRINAWDPWKLLYRRPVLDTDLPLPDLPGPDGITYVNSRGSDIILAQLDAMNVYCAGTPLDNAGLDWGWSGAPYGGTLEDTAIIGGEEGINFQRGTSLGQMFDMLVATGTLDIIIDPIYDLVDRPGLVGELSIFQQAGTVRTGAVFGWDVFPKNCVGLTRVTDGSLRANVLQYYAGQGGVPVVQTDAPGSQAKYGIYFEQRAWPQETATDAVEKLSDRAIALLADGQTTYTLQPAAERAPIPYVEYDVGDMVPVYTSNRFRRAESEYLRVESIPIVIGDDQLARINGLLVSAPDETLGEEADPDGRPAGPNEPAQPTDLNAGDDPPSLLSAVALGTEITLSYNVALDAATVPAASAYAVIVNGVGATETAVAVDGQRVIVTVSASITAGATVTISYTPPVSPLRSSLGTAVPSLAGQAVSTGSAPGPGPPPGDVRSILTFRVTGSGGDTGHPPGSKAGATAHWVTTTSSHTPRTNGGTAGRYFIEGERVFIICGVKPYGAAARIGRAINFHDMPFSGYIWGAVSPTAQDINATAETEGNAVNDWFTLQYTQNSADKHTLVPFAADEWNYWFADITFHRSNGKAKVWLRNSSRGGALGPLVDLTGVRTLNPDTRFYPGAQLWTGLYATNYYGGPIMCDHMAPMVGSSWEHAWQDAPSKVADWGSNGSSYTAIASRQTTDILLPDTIAAEILA